MPHQPSKRGRGRGAARPTRKQAKTAAAAALPITDGEVQWATVQVDVAAERLKAAEHTMLVAQRELADRALLATKMSEAKALSVSAARLAELAQQRQHDAALAEEQATLAAQRKQEADEGLEDARAKEREAMEAVAELRSSLSSSENDDSDA